MGEAYLGSYNLSAGTSSNCDNSLSEFSFDQSILRPARNSAKTRGFAAPQLRRLSPGIVAPFLEKVGSKNPLSGYGCANRVPRSTAVARADGRAIKWLICLVTTTGKWRRTDHEGGCS